MGKITFYYPKLYPNSILYFKLLECMVCTLNYNPCYTFHPTINIFVSLDGTIKIDSIAILLNSLKTNEKLHFITLNHTPVYTLHHKL